MGSVKYIIKKEFDRVFKDKKLVFSMFILPAILMVGIYSLIGTFAGNMAKDVEEHIPTVYLKDVPQEIKAYIDNTGYKNAADINYITNDSFDREKLEEDILNGDIEMLVEFDKNFSDGVNNYNGGKLPGVKIGMNPAKDYSSAAYQTFNEMVLSAYKQQVIIDRIGGADKLGVFEININQITKDGSFGTQFLSMLVPYLTTFLVFASAMGIVTDAIAGEKERGTMARLLMTPVKRSKLAFGKITALTVLSMLSALVYAGSMIVAMPMMLKGMAGTGNIDLGMKISAGQVIQLIVLLIILAYLYVSVISALAIRAKDVKTASTYISPLYIIIMIAALATMFTGSKEMASYLHIIPVYGTALSIQKIMTQSLTGLEFVYSVCGNLLLAFLCTFSVTRSFNSEKVMFNA